MVVVDIDPLTIELLLNMKAVIPPETKNAVGIGQTPSARFSPVTDWSAKFPEANATSEKL